MAPKRSTIRKNAPVAKNPSASTRKLQLSNAETGVASRTRSKGEVTSQSDDPENILRAARRRKNQRQVAQPASQTTAESTVQTRASLATTATGQIAGQVQDQMTPIPPRISTVQPSRASGRMPTAADRERVFKAYQILCLESHPKFQYAEKEDPVFRNEVADTAYDISTGGINGVLRTIGPRPHRPSNYFGPINKSERPGQFRNWAWQIARFKKNMDLKCVLARLGEPYFGKDKSFEEMDEELKIACRRKWKSYELFNYDPKWNSPPLTPKGSPVRQVSSPKSPNKDIPDIEFTDDLEFLNIPVDSSRSLLVPEKPENQGQSVAGILFRAKEEPTSTNDPAIDLERAKQAIKNEIEKTQRGKNDDRPPGRFRQSTHRFVQPLRPANRRSRREILNELQYRLKDLRRRVNDSRNLEKSLYYTSGFEEEALQRFREALRKCFDSTSKSTELVRKRQLRERPIAESMTPVKRIQFSDIPLQSPNPEHSPVSVRRPKLKARSNSRRLTGALRNTLVIESEKDRRQIPTLAHAITKLEGLNEVVQAKIDQEQDEEVVRTWELLQKSIVGQLEFSYLTQEPLNICKSVIAHGTILPDDLEKEMKNTQELEEMVMRLLRPKVFTLIHVYNEADEMGPAAFNFSDDELESDFELELDWDENGVSKRTITIVDVRKKSMGKQNESRLKDSSQLQASKVMKGSNRKRKRSFGNDTDAISQPRNGQQDFKPDHSRPLGKSS